MTSNLTDSAKVREALEHARLVRMFSDRHNSDQKFRDMLDTFIQYLEALHPAQPVGEQPTAEVAELSVILTELIEFSEKYSRCRGVDTGRVEVRIERAKNKFQHIITAAQQQTVAPQAQDGGGMTAEQWKYRFAEITFNYLNESIGNPQRFERLSEQTQDERIKLFDHIVDALISAKVLRVK